MSLPSDTLTDEVFAYLHFASLVKVCDDETLQLDSKYEGANTPASRSLSY